MNAFAAANSGVPGLHAGSVRETMAAPYTPVAAPAAEGFMVAAVPPDSLLGTANAVAVLASLLFRRDSNQSVLLATLCCGWHWSAAVTVDAVGWCICCVCCAVDGQDATRDCLNTLV
jgi:hypothetical protein